MAGWNNHSYLFTQQTPRLTFNSCSLCSASKCPGEFDFHYCVENIRSSLCFPVVVCTKTLPQNSAENWLGCRATWCADFHVVFTTFPNPNLAGQAVSCTGITVKTHKSYSKIWLDYRNSCDTQSPNSGADLALWCLECSSKRGLSRTSSGTFPASFYPDDQFCLNGQELLTLVWIKKC